jgi:translation initiation factor 1 (eIF-1/SUI1)
MRITFNTSKDYLEINKDSSDKIAIIISAQDTKNKLNTIINSVLITEEQLKELIESLDLSSTANNESILR